MFGVGYGSGDGIVDWVVIYKLLTGSDLLHVIGLRARDHSHTVFAVHCVIILDSARDSCLNRSHSVVLRLFYFLVLHDVCCSRALLVRNELLISTADLFA